MFPFSCWSKQKSVKAKLFVALTLETLQTADNWGCKRLVISTTVFRKTAMGNVKVRRPLQICLQLDLPCLLNGFRVNKTEKRRAHGKELCAVIYQMPSNESSIRLNKNVFKNASKSNQSVAFLSLFLDQNVMQIDFCCFECDNKQWKEAKFVGSVNWNMKDWLEKSKKSKFFCYFQS